MQKQARKKFGWTQAELAERCGVSRDWIIGLEKAKPGVELVLVLRPLKALDLSLSIGKPQPENTDVEAINLADNPKPNPRSRRTIMNADVLSIIANGKKLGSVPYRSNRLSFRYAPSWQKSSAAFPLSISMLLAQDEHPHEIIEPYLWGLLPDNNTVLEQWAKRFQVSSRNVFRLLEQVGEDCAGARRNSMSGIQLTYPKKIHPPKPA